VVKPLHIALVVVAGLAFGACGESSDSSSSATDEGSASKPAASGFEKPLGGEKEARATEAGKELGASLGKAELEAKTIGIVSNNAASPAALGLQKATQQAATLLGWKTVVCDGQGQPAQQQRCIDSVLSQKVDGVAEIGLDASVIRDGLTRAKDEGVPIINYGGVVPDDPLFPGQYAPDDAGMAKVLAEWVVEQMGGKGDVFMNNFPGGLWSELRTGAAEDTFKAAPGVKIVGSHSIDYANFNQDIRKAVGAALVSHPGIKAIYGTVDFVPQPTVQALSEKGVDHDDVIVTGFYVTDENMSLLKSGQLDAIATSALNASAWVTIDQFAQHFGRDAGFAKGSKYLSAQPDDLPLEFIQPQVITKEDVQSKGDKAIEPPEDYVAFFTAKWEQEFGSLPLGG
jgi:ABC-type sugar transport system substrate-binding protein